MTEQTLRRRAQRLGYKLQKSRDRTLHLNNHGGWRIVHVDTNSVEAGERFDMTDDDVAAFLKG